MRGERKRDREWCHPVASNLLPTDSLTFIPPHSLTDEREGKRERETESDVILLLVISTSPSHSLTLSPSFLHCNFLQGHQLYQQFQGIQTRKNEKERETQRVQNSMIFKVLEKHISLTHCLSLYLSLFCSKLFSLSPSLSLLSLLFHQFIGIIKKRLVRDLFQSSIDFHVFHSWERERKRERKKERERKRERKSRIQRIKNSS